MVKERLSSMEFPKDEFARTRGDRISCAD